MLLLATLLLAAAPDTLDIGGAPFVHATMEFAPGEVNMAAADVNRDGHLDLLAAWDSRLHVFSGDGNGGFARAGSFPTGPNPTDVQSLEVTGDGIADVLIANHETSYITVLPGDGRGGFGRGLRVEVDVDPHPHAVRAVDVDADGTPDLVVDDRNRGGLRWLRGLGDGSFRSPGTLIDTGGDPYLGFIARDLNGDGRSDFVTPNPRHAAVTLSDGSGWSAPRALGTLAPFGVALSDLNRDGEPDLLAASGESGRDVEVWAGPDFNERMGRFAMARGPKQVATGDLNGDGTGDAVVVCWAGEVLVILGGAELRTVSLPATGNTWGLLVADFNADGRDDVVVTDGSGSGGDLYVSAR